MKSVGWLMTLVGGSCPGSGVAVNVTAPVMGPLSCTTSSNVPPIAWGLLNVTATRTPFNQYANAVEEGQKRSAAAVARSLGLGS